LLSPTWKIEGENLVSHQELRLWVNFFWFF